jgi:hypothetical protein
LAFGVALSVARRARLVVRELVDKQHVWTEVLHARCRPRQTRMVGAPHVGRAYVLDVVRQHAERVDVVGFAGSVGPARAAQKESGCEQTEEKSRAAAEKSSHAKGSIHAESRRRAAYTAP